jgi:hypothetical protein
VARRPECARSECARLARSAHRVILGSIGPTLGENLRSMHAAATAGLGFLLAVLWFDLMFDVQAARSKSRDLSRDVIVSISGYYRRVTTTAHPMNRLVAVVMLVTLAVQIAEIWTGSGPAWAPWMSLFLTAVGVGLAAVRTVRNAVRLGAGGDEIQTQSELARSILHDHITCTLAIVAALFVQLAVAP